MSDQNTPSVDDVPIPRDLNAVPSHVTPDLRARAVAAARAARESGAEVPKLLASDRSNNEPVLNGAKPPASTLANPLPADSRLEPEPQPLSAEEIAAAEREPTLEPAAAPSELEQKIARREREQRIREQEARRFETQNRQQAQQMQEMQQKLARAERALKAMDLAQTDPVAAVRELGIDEKAFIMRRAEMGTDKERVSDVERQIAEERQALQQLRQEIQQERSQAAEQASRAQFAGMIAAEKAKYPVTAAAYEGDQSGLIARAYEVQAIFVQQMGRPPTQAEIAHNLERMERQRADRYRKVALPTAPAAAPKAAPVAPAQPKLTPQAGGEGSGRVEDPTLDESARRANALKAAKEIARQAKQQR